MDDTLDVSNRARGQRLTVALRNMKPPVRLAEQMRVKRSGRLRIHKQPFAPRPLGAIHVARYRSAPMHYELPAVRVGRLVRFDDALLRRRFQVPSGAGNRIEQKGDASMFQAKTRYQSGRVYKKGKKVVKWHGQFREAQIDADGKLVRVQKNICLGTLAELPTKHSAKHDSLGEWERGHR